jgi:hypothetical protein
MKRSTLLAGFVAFAVMLGCGSSKDAALPKISDAAKALASHVTITSLKVSEAGLSAKAQSGNAGVEVTLTPGEVIDYEAAQYKADPEIDPPRTCTMRMLDRDGELLRQDGHTIGVTDTRPLADFEADLKVAEGLATLLSQDQQAWNLYRWEIKDLGRTAHDLQGVRAPAN